MSIQEDDSLQKLPWRVGRWIWQQSSAKGALLLFLFPIALALAASVLLPQIPAVLRSDPIGYQEELSAIQVRFKSWTPFLETIGAFYVVDTLWFRFLLAILAFTLLVALGREIGDLLVPPPVSKPRDFYHSADVVSVFRSLSQDQVIKTVQTELQSRARHVRCEQNQDGVYLYGERAAWAKSGTAVAYLGLLFMVVGLAVNGRWGWQHDNVRVPTNESIRIGPQGNHHIQLVSVETEPVEALEVQVDGSRPLLIRWDARDNYGSFRYRWVSKGGPFVQVHAQRANGAKLALINYESRPAPAETLRFAFSYASPEQEADRLFIVAETKVVGRLAWLNRDTANGEIPRFYLWTFGEDGRTPLGEQEFTASDPGPAGHTLSAQIDDVTYVLDVTRYVVVDVAYQPGLWALWGGGFLLLGGVSIRLLLRRQTWAWIAPNRDGYEVRIRESQAPIWLRRQHQNRTHARVPESKIANQREFRAEDT